MAEKTTTVPPAAGAAVAGQVVEGVRKNFEEQLGRAQSWAEEFAKVERKIADGAAQAVDESAKLWRESFQYAVQLSAEWRRLTLDATRKVADLYTLRS